MLIAPSLPTSKESADRSVQFLEDQGYEVRVGKCLYLVMISFSSLFH